MFASTLECRCLVRHLPCQQARRTPAAATGPHKDKDEIVNSITGIASSNRSILAPQISPMGNPDDVRQPDRAVAASAFETFGRVDVSVQIYARLDHRN
jgi:hypothetical protein